MMTATLAYVLGLLLFILGWLVGLVHQATINLRRDQRRRERRREQIELDGPDAVECWKTQIDWQWQRPTNGTPFEGDEVA